MTRGCKEDCHRSEEFNTMDQSKLTDLQSVHGVIALKLCYTVSVFVYSI